MVPLADISPGQLFAWLGGIFVRSDSTKKGRGAALVTSPPTAFPEHELAAVTLIRKTMPTISGLSPDTNVLGATVWMRLDTVVALLTADIYHGNQCVHRMWEEQVDE